MNAEDAAKSEIADWQPEIARRVAGTVGPLVRGYFRSEVHGLDHKPTAGGALVVSNHSGGMFTPDILLFAPAYYDRFGYDRRVYTLAHNTVFIGPFADWLPRAGVIHATRENAAAALRSGAIVLVFPGGDHDSYRPTSAAHTIDFNGRTGYVRTAIEAGVPIVPMVSIGGQETQLFLTRGRWLVKRLGLKRARIEALPITFGFPFGFSVFVPPNLPLPAKIVSRVHAPVDVVGRFGDDPVVEEVDAHVRSLMQGALDDLARQRRFPMIG